MDYGDLINAAFPHRDEHGRPSYRTYQFEVIRDTLCAFDDPSISDVVVEAPTGAGKTSIAVTVARVMTRRFPEAMAHAKRELGIIRDPLVAYGIMAPHQAHLITSMKMLQDAYLGDDPEIRLVKGKSNYDCCRGGQQSMAGIQQLSCDDAEQIFGRMCENDCPYKEARNRAHWAPIALHNFDSFLNQASLGQVFLPRRLLTLDEAHNTEEKLRSVMTVNFDQALFESVGLQWREPRNLKDMASVVDWAESYVLRSLKVMNDDMTSELAELRSGKQGPRQIQLMSRIANKQRRVSRIGQRLERFVISARAKRPVRWVAYMDEGRLYLEPVDAGRFVPNALLKFGEKRLHLSATFLNSNGDYTDAVKLKRARHITVPSTFPPENRRIVVRSAGNLGLDSWKTNLVNVMGRLREILEENRGKRGVIHCTSYGMANDIKNRFKSKRLVFYDRRTRDDVVNSFMAGREAKDAVLVAVALKEGYDFKDDLCRFQVIVRVPFPVNNKKGWMQARIEKNRAFYYWRTSLSLVQTYGRGIRSERDWCLTYVLDDRFHSFVNGQRRRLPSWFLEAIS